jgi:diguanylate cyclase (GGDEF)-like protein
VSCTLVVLHPEGPLHGRRFEIGPAGDVLGREHGVVIDVEGVSRTHARIRLEPDGWFVEDLRSTNGTYVNDDRVERSPIRHGDTLRLGVAIVQVLIGAEVDADYDEAMRRIAMHDPVSGVPTRRAFLQFLERQVARVARGPSSVSLVLCDIDFFERIAGQQGPLAADAVLREVARRIQPCVPEGAFVARCGAHEFACVLPGTRLSDAVACARSMRDEVCRKAVHTDAGRIPISLSLGVAELVPGEGIGELLARAGGKLLAAKKGGRDRVEA